LKINLVVLKTSRPDDLALFYGQLGIKFENHRHGSGPLHYAAEIDNVVFEIYPLPKDKEKADDTLRLGFTVDDLDEVIGRLKRSGGKIVKEPNMTEWGYVSIIEDMDGRKVELKDKQKTGVDVP
jgi:predicted enzyme related to lactoylglutathione lyase